MSNSNFNSINWIGFVNCYIIKFWNYLPLSLIKKKKIKIFFNRERKIERNSATPCNSISVSVSEVPKKRFLGGAIVGVHRHPHRASISPFLSDFLSLPNLAATKHLLQLPFPFRWFCRASDHGSSWQLRSHRSICTKLLYVTFFYSSSLFLLLDFILN